MNHRVVNLINKEKIIQKSKEWYEKRRTMITASSAANLLVKNDIVCDSYIKEYNLYDIFDKNNRCANPYSSKTQFILDKCIGSKFKGSVATYHGQKYEDVVIDIYSKLNNKQVLEFGILTHEKYSWLGASPDGITPDGIMLEIKCPYRRKITGIPPFYYWIQVQLQLEVCNLDVCEFLEYEFMEFMSKEEFLDDITLDKKVHHKGGVIMLQKINNSIIDQTNNEYIYPPKELLDNSEKIIEWVDSEIERLKSTIKPEYKNSLNIEPIYWKCVDFNITTIKRDQEWFNNVLPLFKDAWNEIEYYKSNENYKSLISKKRKKGDTSGKVLRLDIKGGCQLTDDEK